MAVVTPRRVRRLLKHTPWSPGGRGEGVGVAVAVIVIAGAVVGSTSFTVVGDRPSTDTGRSVPTLLPPSLPSLSASPVFAAADPALSSRRGEEEEVLPHLRGEEKTAHRSLAALHGANPRARLDELERLVEGLIENVRPRLQRWVLVVVQLMAALLVSVSPLLRLVTLSILLTRFTIAVTMASSLYLACVCALFKEEIWCRCS